MNNKIVSTKTTSALFLAIVMVTGTIALSFPSFIIKGVNAQSQPYYGYNSYGPPEYPSFKPDYKPAYPSYGKDNRDKSKDSSDIINKIKCTTNNIVVNGNNTGDINIGNKGGVATAEEGDWSVSSSGNGGYEYDNNKKDKGFECIIKNNNIINNVVAGAGGNVTDGNVTDTCEECFLDALGPTNLILLESVLDNLPDTATNNLEELCIEVAIQIASGTSSGEITDFINSTLSLAEITLDTAELESLVACLFEVFGG